MCVSSHIAAAYTYFRSIKQDDSLRKRGLMQHRNQARRRRERMIRVRDILNQFVCCIHDSSYIYIYVYLQKLQERTSLLDKVDMPSKSKEKWRSIFRADVMSSEESSEASDDVFVKPLPWRAEKVTRFFTDIDEKALGKKTSQAQRQRKARKISINSSTRPVPQGLPKWAIDPTCC